MKDSEENTPIKSHSHYNKATDFQSISWNLDGAGGCFVNSIYYTIRGTL